MDNKLTAFPSPITMSLDTATMQLNKFLHQRQPNPQTALCLPPRCVYLNKDIEDVGQVIVGDADSGVANADCDLITVPLDGQPDVATLITVLGSIV
jgi:hypothetical protein